MTLGDVVSFQQNKTAAQRVAEAQLVVRKARRAKRWSYVILLASVLNLGYAFCQFTKIYLFSHFVFRNTIDIVVPLGIGLFCLVLGIELACKSEQQNNRQQD